MLCIGNYNQSRRRPIGPAPPAENSLLQYRVEALLRLPGRIRGETGLFDVVFIARQNRTTMESAHLEVIDTNGRRQVPLDGPLTIGRNFTNLLVLDESLASRFHCVVEKTANGYVVRDLDSRNGTRLNGKPVKSAVMANGDVITIGKTELKLVVPEGAAARVGRAERASSTARP